MGFKDVPELAADARLASAESFSQWAGERWLSYSCRSPVAIRPVRRGYAEAEDERGRVVELYAGLYPLETFEDLVDFSLWETYIASLHQSLLRDEEPDLSWFVPISLEEAISEVFESWQSSEILDGKAIQDWFGGYPLPERIRWFAELHHRLAKAEESEQSIVFLSVAEEGYGVFLALRAFTMEEIQAMMCSPFIDLTEMMKDKDQK